MKIIQPVPVELLTDTITGQVGQADLLALPESTEEVADFIKKANDVGKSVVTIGNHTGVVSAVSASESDYLLQLTAMDEIISLDEETLTLTVEAGASLQSVRDYLADTPYFYAPDPGTKEASVGGNAATNAGGMRALKYGVTRDNVRGLEVVLADGRVLQLGGLNVKSSSGYDLKDLFIGSEGTLGVITKLQLKLLPRPLFEQHMLIGFAQMADLAPVIFQILASPVTPTALEFVEKVGFDYGGKVVDASFPPVTGEAYLLLTVDGSNEEALLQESELLAEIARDAGAIDTRILSKEEAVDTWLLRDNVIQGVRAETEVEPYDIVVPVNQITRSILKMKELGDKYQVHTLFFGHAGDGNIHLTVLRDDLSDEAWEKTIHNYNEEVYEVVRQYGGLPSAEHGIGSMKKPYLLSNLGEDHVLAMKQIKAALDPKGILNPNKIFDL